MLETYAARNKGNRILTDGGGKFKQERWLKMEGKKITAPNDKLTKALFTLSAGEYEECIKGRPYLLEEGKIYDKEKRGKIPVITTLKIAIDEDKATVENYKPLDMFDRAVLTACISEFENGNRLTTPANIYRIISGKRVEHNPTKKQADEIMASVRKLSSTGIFIDMKDVCAKFKYNGGEPHTFSRFVPILPCETGEGIFHGNICEVIKLRGEYGTPLMKIAKMKKQFLTFDGALLNVGERHCTRDTAAVVFYTATRVFESIKAATSKRTTPPRRTITIDDILEKCRLTGATAYRRKAAYAAAEDFLRRLKEKRIIRKCDAEFMMKITF